MQATGSNSGTSENQSRRSAAESVADPTPTARQAKQTKLAANHAKTQSFGNAEAPETNGKPAAAGQTQGVEQDKQPQQTPEVFEKPRTAGSTFQQKRPPPEQFLLQPSVPKPTKKLDLESDTVPLNLKNHGVDEWTQKALQGEWPPSAEILQKYQNKIFKLAMFMLETYLDREESQASNKSILTSEKFLTKTVQQLQDLVLKQKLSEQQAKFNLRESELDHQLQQFKQTLKDKEAQISQLIRKVDNLESDLKSKEKEMTSLNSHNQKILKEKEDKEKSDSASATQRLEKYIEKTLRDEIQGLEAKCDQQR